MAKYKIQLNDKSYYIYADSQEHAVKKLRDAQAKRVSDDNYSEFRKELAKWQDLYMNKKLITSSELQKEYYKLREKYGISENDLDKHNINDAKLTSKHILEKAKSLGGKAKQNGATGVLGISITSPQGSDEFAEWLEKNNIHYNSDGRQYYVEIQDCEIEDELIQSGSEEAFKENIATEIRAGKDPKQAVAIAYNVQRENDMSATDFGYVTPGKRVPEPNVYYNRVTPDELKTWFRKVMSEGNDTDIVNVLIGKLSELKKDYQTDINNSKLNKEDTKRHYGEYKKIVNAYKNSQISKEYKTAVDNFLSTIRDLSIYDMPRGIFNRYFAVSSGASETYMSREEMMKDLYTFGDDEVYVYSLKNEKDIQNLGSEDLMFVWKDGKIIKKGPMMRDSAINDIDGKLLPQSAKELKEELGLARKVIGSHLSRGIREYKPRNNQFNNADVAEINEAINDAIKYLDQGFGHDSYRRLEIDLDRIKQTMPKDTSSEEYKILNKVLTKGNKALNAIKEYLKKNDSSTIKDTVSKVENIGKFTLWQDNDTKEYYFDATVSRSGKTLYRLNTTDINKAREKVKKELEWVTDSAVKDNNKDSSNYTINYRNSYTGERNKETIKANSVIEAIKKFADAVALRGWGTRNIDIISISPNEGYMKLYGSLQALLTSKEFRDSSSVRDADNTEPKNWVYVMYGSDNREYKVENLTKGEAEHLLKNNRLLGFDGKIFEQNV